MNENLERLANMIETQTLEHLHKHGIMHCDSDAKVKIRPGNKYTKIDVGTSGKYMIDDDGNIYGIKGYGQIHRRHYYGTLETIENYYWGDYTAQRKSNEN